MGVVGGSGQYVFYCAGGQLPGSLVSFQDYLHSGAFGYVFSLSSVAAHDSTVTGRSDIYDWFHLFNDLVI